MNQISRRTFQKLLGGTAALAAFGPGAAFAQATPVKGGVLRIAAAAEPAMIVEITQGAAAASSSGRVIEGLISVGLDHQISPLLAESWEVSEDGKVYTFKLREGVKWHDGRPFTSKDVAFSINLLKEVHPRRRATFRSLVSTDDSDPTKCVLTFSEPVPFLLPALSSYDAPIVPAHLYEGTNPATNPYNTKPIGTGPFRFVEWQRGSHYVLEANKDYWQPGLPYLEGIVVRFIPDAAARAAAFEAGEVDIGWQTPVTYDDLERLVATGNFEAVTDGYDQAGTLNQIFFNLSSEPLQKLEVRQAIAHAIDIPSYIQRVWRGYAVPAATCISPQVKEFHDASIQHHAHDVKKADELLDAAGYRRGADGRRFSLRMTANPSNSRMSQGAIFVRSALAQLGIDVQVQNYDFPTYVKKVYTDREFDLDIQVLVSSYDPTAGVERGYHSRNIKQGLAFSNNSGYSNPRVDEIFDTAAKENDPDRRRALYFELQKILHDDLPAVNLVSFQSVTLATKKLHDHTIDQLNIASSFVKAWKEA